jgi:ferrous-iron efflux pump FieF
MISSTLPERNAGLMRSATYASVIVACVLIIIKSIAYLLTDSVALLSTLIDSLVDAAASLINLLAVRHALTPPDPEHRFGHGKAESLAGLAQAAFITGSALFLAFEAGHRLLVPRPLENTSIGIIVLLISIVLTIALVHYQRYVVRKTGSVAISADSLHYRGDVLLNLSVALSLALSALFNMKYMDPLFAIGITGYILSSAWLIASRALDHLMDRELPDGDRARIRAIALAHPEVRNMHDLRTRTSGQTTFIQLHLEMAGAMSLLRAHAISDEVEAAIRSAYPNAEVIIHEDPEGIYERRSALEG